MESYRRLFSLALGHEYFSNGAWGAVDVMPTDATRRVFDTCGLLLRASRDTVTVMYESGRLAAMRLMADDAGGELRVRLKGVVRDRGFRNYTAFAGKPSETLPCFGNGAAPDLRADGGRLSREETASIADCRPVRDLLAGGVLSASEARMPPDFLFDIGLPATTLPPGNPPSFFVRFGARNLLWNYYLLGSLNRDNLFIVDLDQKIEFEALGEGSLAGGRPARVFRSTRALPIHEQSALRFQLRERGNGSGKVIVKRLPVATDNLSLQTVGGERQLVSNVFVNF